MSSNFRALVENADRKFARVRDLPAFGRAQSHYFHKVFKAYMKLWNYQQSHRSKLVESGLNRWEIGEIASRIGQLYFSQYMRTSEARFLLESYVFYEAILKRRYFEEGKRDLSARSKELRFYARFLLVALIVDRREMVLHLGEKLRALVEDSKSNFRETNFKEWRIVVQEITRFTRADTDLTYVRPLRYCAMLDSYPASQTYLARFHAKKLFKFRDALLASYHRNEVKYAEVTLDTYRMMQCLEWEPSDSFYQKRPVETKDNGFVVDHTLTSGIIDMKLAADMADPSLPPNPRKAVLYRPTVSHLLAVLAMICDELSPECVMLIYLSASGGPARENVGQAENAVGSSRTSKSKLLARASQEQKSYKSEPHSNGHKSLTGDYYNDYLWLGPRGGSGSNNLYPGDLIPFTRKPLFLIIDSDTSRAFKVLNGAERGEPVALLLSPLKPSLENPSADDTAAALNGSQFTFFLTAPLQAFCQMLGLSNSDREPEVYDEAESILSASFSEWETSLLTSKVLNLVWAQVLPDQFLRRLILRFIFCRSVLTSLSRTEDGDPYLPQCHPDLPESVSAGSKPVQSAVQKLADHLGVAKSFHFNKT